VSFGNSGCGGGRRNVGLVGSGCGVAGGVVFVG